MNRFLPLLGLVMTSIVGCNGGSDVTGSNTMSSSAVPKASSASVAISSSALNSSIAEMMSSEARDSSSVSTESSMNSVENSSSSVSVMSACESASVVTNLSLKQPARESSNDGNSGPASAAFDGDLTTRWSSAYQDGEWLSIDLGSKLLLCSANISWEAAFASEYQIQTSDDGQNWTTVILNDHGQGGDERVAFPVNYYGRYVRLQSLKRATEWGISIWELEVLGSREGTPFAVINYEPLPSEVGKSITLNAGGSFDDDGSIIQYEWLIVPPEGTPWTSQLERTDYTPQFSGDYQLSLTVTDNDGKIGHREQLFSVQSEAHSGYFPPNVTRPKIMLLGDSLTGGPGCWKKLLRNKLEDNGITNFEFVGTRNDDCGGGVPHEGHSCALAQDFASQSYNNQCSGTESGLRPLLDRNKPDLVVMTLGTNDAWGVPGTSNILQRYAVLINQMRAFNPNMVIAVARIPKMRPDGNQAVYNQVAELVAAVPAWAENLNQSNSPIFVADLWTNFSLDDTTDGVHPNNNLGSQKVADNWYATLEKILNP